MDGTSNYIVSDILGFYIVEANSATKAWAKHTTRNSGITDVIAFDKKELHGWLTSRGYQTIAKTTHNNVYTIN